METMSQLTFFEPSQPKIIYRELRIIKTSFNNISKLKKKKVFLVRKVNEKNLIIRKKCNSHCCDELRTKIYIKKND